MLLCPRCTKGLTAARGRAGITFGCGTCRGQVATMPVLRKAIAAEAVNDVWRRARTAKRRGDRPCPSCHDGMAEVGVHHGSYETVLDACDRCQMVWFDFEELERLPPRPVEVEEPLSARAQEAIARAKILRRGPPLPADPEPSLPRIVLLRFGVLLPQKAGEPEHSLRPWVTWGLATSILLLTAALQLRDLVRPNFDGTLRTLGSWIEEWGFLPAQPWRHGGLTLLTCFFLHAGWWHALGNAYFLTLAGEDVEELLGGGRYLLLLLAATVAGSLGMVVTEPRSTIPCVGASGGIAGIFGYYALALPRVRIGIFFRHGFAVPVRWLFALWFLGEWVLAGSSRWSGVAHGAHVGGALAGLAWWTVERAVRGGRKVEARSDR